ncbi:DUF5627 domain-containing protein [Fulvivirga ligni]|uniref:DUF5627 domain-containing protein n=1 Tax=Fulvivirga ligni TaxID=2904246 RepID=UPI001F171BB7|nr:DUF5627 domain-containing protein [Fulvivirga ligni]UII19585.1 DUF5627 domain-containing protein [Fulvivirga ligni]
MKNNFIKIFLLVLMAGASSCDNNEWEFPDYEYQSIYFAYQYPVRTITLGEDIFDTSLDNQHKCMIMATTGGVYDNDGDVTIDIAVDNTLCDNLLFEEAGDDVIPMPASYYELAADHIIIPKGQLSGGLEVQLTDAFFADPMALSNNYVIPLVMTNVLQADTILSGVSVVEKPNRTVPTDWSVQPKDYILYAVKYVNPWHGNYLRRGEDVIERDNETAETVVRHKEYVEYDEVKKLTTTSLNQAQLPLVFKNTTGENVNIDLLLSFDEDGNCSVSTNSSTFSASGSGKFVQDGEKNSWGEKDRDAIYLSYEIDFNDMQVSSTDTLVLRDRAVTFETYMPVNK